MGRKRVETVNEPQPAPALPTSWDGAMLKVIHGDGTTPASTPTSGALDDPALYINRELSWLEFNRRVLEEAQDPEVPLLDRLKFLAIFSSNLDEFFMVRVGGLQQKVQAHIAQGSGADRMPPSEQLDRISQLVRQMVEQQYRCLKDEALP